MSLMLRKRFFTGLAALLMALSGYCMHVYAEGAPSSQPLWYAGTVSDNAGTPLSGSHQVSVRLFQQASGSSALCETGPAAIPFERGRFRIELASACVEVVRANPDLFVQVAVDDESKPFPRSKIGAVPYALEANHAASASAAAGPLKQTLESLPKITEWKAFRPVVFVSNTQLGLTDAQASGFYRRVGDTVEASYLFRTNAVSSLTGIVSFALPDDLKPELAKMVDFAQVGSGNLYSPAGPGGGAASWPVVSELNHATLRIQLVFGGQQGANAVLAHDAPALLSAGGSARFNVSIPVSGWTLSTP